MHGPDSTNRPAAPGGPEPVAIVGIGCRLPGGIDSPDSFWAFLTAGRDAISPIPGQRWQFYQGLGADYAAALRRVPSRGGFLTDIEGFDAEFFGLSPREAELMDPQHRLLLEVTWEALEHAGIPPLGLAGADVGVFVAVDSDDYGRRLLEDLPGIEAWTGIGAAMCAAANRISYALDLRGPSVALDTACSGSLVSVHLAAQSLRTGESDVALAAGVNVLLSPGLTLTLEASGALAPDGRCKTFDASADGYGRGEGCAVLVLKRLADAQRDGDRVLALVRGSAVSQDGRTSGIMAPNSAAQEHLILRACRSAGLPPGSVDYVEAHGTGTSLGDQLEVDALTQVYGAGREPGRSCLIGSVKPNIGHLEAAAGAASLIKAALAISHQEIPPSLNLATPNPGVDWDASGLRVVTETTAWPEHDGPRRAGVSAFGFGGTIAHVVIEEAAGPARKPAPSGSAEAAPRLYPLSARSQAALQAQAGAVAGWLGADGAGAPLASVGHTLGLRRSHLNQRAAIVAAGREDLAARLRLLADGEPSPDVVTGSALTDPGAGLVWVFSGHGSHWTGMGQGLLASEPAFSSVIDTLDPIYQEEAGFSPRQVLLDGELEEISRIQAMTFAMQVGLAQVWRSYGVTPSAVIGHSLGEFAAAVACGGLSLEDGGRIACRRAMLMRRVEGRGAMAMVSLPFGEVAERLAEREGVVAAIDAAPGSTVVSGDIAAVEALMADWQALDITMRRVATNIAFHCWHMDCLMDDIVAAAADLSVRAPSVPMYTTSRDDPRVAPALDGPYWADNTRNPVRLTAALTAAAADGYRAFLEISPHPLVTHSIRECLVSDDTEDDGDSIFIGCTLRRNQPERDMLLASVGAVHCAGIDVDWQRLQPEGELVTLPLVPWQRRRHWRDSARGAAGEGLVHDIDSHSLLGSQVTVAGRSLRLWRTRLDESSRPYPGNHAVNGVEIVPAAVLITTFLAAARAGTGASAALADLELRVPLTVTGSREIQVLYDDSALRLASRAPAGDGEPEPPWVIHASVAVTLGAATAEPPAVLSDAAGLAAEPEGGKVIREMLSAVGVPEMAFGWEIEELVRGAGTLRARIRVDQPAQAPPTWAPVLDAALSAVQAVFPGPPALRMIDRIGEILLAGEPPSDVLVDITTDQQAADVVQVLVATADGRVAARLAGVRCAVMGDARSATASPRDIVHQVTWRTLELPAEPAPGAAARSVILIALPGERGYAATLSERLASAGLDTAIVGDPGELGGQELTATTDVLVVLPPAAGAPVPEAAVQSAWLLARAAQQLAAAETAAGPRLWCLTAGVRDAWREGSLPQAAAWGLSRVISGEHPGLWGGVIDLASDDLTAIGDSLPRVLQAGPRDDIIALAGPSALVARLTPVAAGATHPPVACSADGTYLITGGLGALGMQVAGWLAERGARRIVLASRRSFPPRAAWAAQAGDPGTQRIVAGIQELEKRGVTVRVLSLDISDAQAAARQLTPDALGLPPIRGVVHAAGVLDSRMLIGLDEKSLRTVFRPKVEGAWVLHQLFPPGSLEFLVLFSSAGHLVRMPGQSSYGAASAFLDGLADVRNASGCADTTSFGWTNWQGQGMAVSDAVEAARLERGVGDIPASGAFSAWDYAAQRGPGYYPVFGLLAAEPGTERPALLSELAADADSTSAEPAGQQAEPFADLGPDELREHVLSYVGGQFATEMKLPADTLNYRRSLIEQGLDSVMTMVIRRRMEKRFQHKLPAALLWHQPTVSAITDYVVEQLTAPDAQASAAGADAEEAAEAAS